MHANPHMHTEICRSMHADRMRKSERDALVAAALGKDDEDRTQTQVLSRLGALLPTARLSLQLRQRRPAGGVA